MPACVFNLKFQFVAGVFGHPLPQFKHYCADYILSRVCTEDMMACVSRVRNKIFVLSLVTCKWVSGSDELRACTNRANADQICNSLTFGVAKLPNEWMTDKSLFWAYCM